MSFKSLRQSFNKFASHGAFMVATVLAAGSGGYTTFNALDTIHDVHAVVENVQMYSAAEGRLRAQASTITLEQAKLDFTANSIAIAQKNLGTSTAPLGTQMKDLETVKAEYDRNAVVQEQRLAAFLKEIWTNPAISEKQADKIYTDLFFSAQRAGLGHITDYFSPMTDALTLRDETLAKLNIPHDPAKVTDAQVMQALTAARAADSSHDTQETLGGIGEAAATLLLGGGLFAAALRGRKRDEEDEKADKDRADRDAEAAARLARQQAQRAEKPVAVVEEPPVKKVAAGPGKFSV